ncbi:tetraprenyl-beta-curcumene synthase family protein [Paenibacillus sp. P96]|uniref:Tetraprenyl-beta-curcumene synthase family protein n=2 Tax=Paenibacillus zeirhizosphaerae TaxID=2987519 RepID=A0ABT9FT04_9BACL|nr:tetraprenyl-beta-curcumene synthase family protein [Paenibacillus sp. P96]MDP4097745.1 tetraprenyl-beta-curcumene synthase family protein [Paenibacillus sp. P96]
MNDIELRQFQAPRGPLGLMNRMYRYILPETQRTLEYWRQTAEQIPDIELKKQALASISGKAFHCIGGAVYAAVNLEVRHTLIQLIVAYQTISDYLDNLCDRSTSLDPEDFRLLHQSMLDAVNPEAEPVHYYALREEQEDGGYLLQLVETCQSCIRKLPGYEAAMPYILDLARLYTDLQVYKHIKPELREAALMDWWHLHKERTPELRWNEFAAATGSTLGVFMLFQAATDPHLTDAGAAIIHRSYFPHVCSLHILLDYLIDQHEDRIGGDLNFCNYYEDTETMLNRLVLIADRARTDVSSVVGSSFHRMIIEGLLALYLSDPKVREQQEVYLVSKRLMKKSPLMRLFFRVNSRWIRRHL